ncbi:MAG: sodium/alanine symporter [Gammaproteobacteria bacterium]|nr:sodium/alanine symporter [Gammaproteobacteria bacterium]|tara:strand:+ start:825 stop:2156 length:1332 start_codon:yes stop_codon:yes gene_type:complete
MELIDKFFLDFVTIAWGQPTQLLLLGAGLFFAITAKFKPYRYLIHAFDVLRGKHPSKGAGEVSHFKALTATLSGTIGLGNIAGVAAAIYFGGPGAVFWMWVTAIFGIATKFFTATLSSLYREINPDGTVNAGTMYVIKNGLPKYMLPFAYMFAFFGMIAGLPAVQASEIVRITESLFFSDVENFAYIAGAVMAAITAIVIIGGLKRIANVSALLVPLMSVIYFASVFVIIILNFQELIPAISSIFYEAFNFKSAVSGGLVMVILTGIKRGVFSNEAGVGTEALIHGAATTTHPAKQGLVAMTGPIFDTLIMCTLTAIVILMSGVEPTAENKGVLLTAESFQVMLGSIGPLILFFVVLCFGLSTIFTYSFYGTACVKFLFGKRGVPIYQIIFISAVFGFSVGGFDLAINVVDSAFAMMIFPTLISTIWLAPKVVDKANDYFRSL